MKPRLTCLFALVAIAACASAAERLEQGMALEAEGRWQEAVYRYADAIEKDDTLSAAWRRLEIATDSALILGMAWADRRGPAEQDEAAELFLDLDRLVLRVREVGYRAPRPAGFDEARRQAMAGAVRQLTAEAARARADGRWSDARSLYRRLRDRYEPDAAALRASWASEAETLVEWGDDEMDRGRYRAAWERAMEAMDLEGPVPDRSRTRAREIQATAEARGTRYVAVLPVSARSVVGGMSADRFAVNLGDILELDHWRAPPPLVAVADPVVVRREVRRSDGMDGRLSAGELARVLRRLEADYGVSIEVAALTLAERIERTETREARTRNGRTVNYQARRVSLAFHVEADVLVIGADGLEVVGFEEEARVSDDVWRGTYAGDPSDLDLGRNERRLFDPEVERTVQGALLDELAERLARELGPRVYDAVVRRIP